MNKKTLLWVGIATVVFGVVILYRHRSAASVAAGADAAASAAEDAAADAATAISGASIDLIL